MICLHWKHKKPSNYISLDPVYRNQRCTLCVFLEHKTRVISKPRVSSSELKSQMQIELQSEKWRKRIPQISEVPDTVLMTLLSLNFRHYLKNERKYFRLWYCGFTSRRSNCHNRLQFLKLCRHSLAELADMAGLHLSSWASSQTTFARLPCS